MCLFSKIIKSAISLHPTVGVFQQIFYILYPSNCHECFSIKNHLCIVGASGGWASCLGFESGISLSDIEPL